MKPRLIVVLGMHRSGTSLITRSLAAIGANFGNNLIPPQPDNDKGFWEDSDIIAFNDELLNSCGMTWYSTEPWHTKIFLINVCLNYILILIIMIGKEYLKFQGLQINSLII